MIVMVLSQSYAANILAILFAVVPYLNRGGDVCDYGSGSGLKVWMVYN